MRTRVFFYTAKITACFFLLTLLCACSTAKTPAACAPQCSFTQTAFTVTYGGQQAQGELTYGSGQAFLLCFSQPEALQGLEIACGTAQDCFDFSYSGLQYHNIRLPQSSPVYLLYTLLCAVQQQTPVCTQQGVWDVETDYGTLTLGTLENRICSLSLPQQDFYLQLQA